MIIKKLVLQEGFKKSEDTYGNINLIYSKENSRGKSTYLRLLFYAFGYPIPPMKGINFNGINSELYIEEKGKNYLIVRTSYAISVTSIDENTKIIFSLPNEHNAFLCYMFNSDKIKILNNIIGIMYIDQEKGWTLLNRGTVIGKIKFSIEELLSGLSGIDCDNLIEQKRVLAQNEKKYQAMLNINDLSEEVYRNNGEIFISDVEKGLSSQISLLDLKIFDIKGKINSIEESIKQEESFWKFIDSMHLQISYKNEIFYLNRENIVYSSESIEYLKARKSLLTTDLHKLYKQKSELKNKLEDYYAHNTEITKSLGDTQEVIINRQLSTVSFDNDSVNKLLNKTQDELSKVKKEIKKTLRTNNSYIQKIYDYVKEYAQKLKIEDKIDGKKDYIFTNDLKSFSGANLQKLVFAFKVAFLKVIEEVLNTKLIMVLDSPRGRELDNENLKLIMKIVNEDLKDNQIFIASIYDDFNFTNKIELTNLAIDDRNI